jgi:hypothetical protein
MKAPIDMEVVNLQQVLAGFKGYEKEAGDAIDFAVFQTANAIRKDAINRLQGMFGSLRHIGIGATLAGHMYTEKVQQGEWLTGNDMEYAPYIEFGTGDLVFTNFDFDEDARKVASQYKGKGIRKVNIRGDSFLNWGAVNQQKKLLKRLETELNKINR